ncbi:MAG: peptidoglycan DD-metalloendopeptidase family protein [Aquisalimonadaceae bacterium]
MFHRPLIFLCLLLAGPASLMAQDYQAREAELEALRKEIGRIEEGLERSRSRRDTVSTELRTLEQSIGRSARRLRELAAERRRNAQRVGELERERNNREAAVAGQKQYLASEVRSAYVMGRQQYLQLLLNHEDPATLDRMLVYVEYLGRARNRRIESALEDLQALAEVRQSLEREQARLSGLEQEQAREAEQLQGRREERSRLLAGLESEIQTDRAHLDRLAEDEQALQSLLDDLRSALADIPERELGRVPFADQRGRLSWPLDGALDGALAARYGSSRGRAGDGRWRGILLSADRGTPVSAVAHGQVVFANWLRGLGLLLIIDHGDGYMTLYGHSDSLYKDVGDWVDAGEIIASVGDTGGPDRAGLYFELRVGGKPQDPLAWLRGERRRDP